MSDIVKVARAFMAQNPEAPKILIEELCQEVEKLKKIINPPLRRQTAALPEVWGNTHGLH